MSKSEHVLIIDLGRDGQSVVCVLVQEGTSYFALDLDTTRVQVARNAGEPVSFGDIKRHEVLEATGLGRVKMVVITLNNMHKTQHVLGNIISMHPSIPVYVHATNDDYVKTFIEMGAEEAVSDTKETSLVLASYVMLGHGLSYSYAYQTITHIRHSRYASLQDLFIGSDDDSFSDEDSKAISCHAFPLHGEAHAIGKTIRELPLSTHHSEPLLVRRKTERIRDLDPDFVLKNGDILVVTGKQEEIISFENWCLQGDI